MQFLCNNKAVSLFPSTNKFHEHFYKQAQRLQNEVVLIWPEGNEPSQHDRRLLTAFNPKQDWVVLSSVLSFGETNV